ncbi:MAG TPA: amidohydrolase family protein [Steroidobacteraceae bacterium]
MRRSWLAICILFLLFGSSVMAQDPAQRRYTVLIMGNPAGVQTTRVGPDGEHEFTFEYNDRGRGPKLHATIRLNERGLPVSLTASGNDYLKAEVHEEFTWSDSVARWQNNGERGERKLASPAFYLSLSGIPEELGLLAAALLEAEDQRLTLLPEGEASLTRAGETFVGEGSRKRRVVAYEISGLSFAPVTVWMDEQNQLFAAVDSWLSIVREGWEKDALRLLEIQDAAAARRTFATARALTDKPDTPLAIVNANVFEPASGRTRPGLTVLIEGNRIVSIGADGSVKIPANARRIDARGRTLLPGLWDMHAHIAPTDGILNIAAGVTSVRDLANDNEALLEIKRKIEAGEEIGPRIVMRGFMDGRGPYAGPTKVFVDTEEEGRATIASYKKRGYEGIKIYSSIKPELVPTLIRLAHEAGLKVSGHVPAFMTAQQFVEAGADELQHINFVFLNFFDDVKDTRTPARFVSVAERGATLDLHSERVRSFVQLLKQRKVIVDPTVGVFYAMFTDRPGSVSSNYAAIADRLPPQVRRGFLGGGLPIPEGMDERYKASARALLDMVKLLYDAGIPIVAGTDGLAGFALHRELELYVEAGIPAPDVLRIATLGAARVAGRDKELGSIEPGKLADLVLVDGDPASRISDIRRTSLVIKDGAVYDPAALYKSIGVRP